MSEQEILETGLEQLKKDTGILGKWLPQNQGYYDGKLILSLGKEKITFFTEIKKELRIHQIPDVLTSLKGFAPVLLVVGRLLPNVKEELRQKQIAYLEANGNFYYRTADTWIFLDARSPISFGQNPKNRAFTKTGLKVLFEILNNPELLQRPYRTIAEKTKTSVGNVANILNGLKQKGFLVQLRKNEFRLQMKEALINNWADAYVQSLKPGLKIGTFRFVGKETHWKDVALNKEKTFWGGEPGADILTRNLKPEEFTLYTEESRNDLIKRYRLVPDERGNVVAFQKFWQHSQDHGGAAPPLVVYADLLASNDSRCIETAKRIFNGFLQD